MTEGCICSGNWRSIIEETEPLFGNEFVDRHGVMHRLLGVLWADDDFYYVMRETELQKTHLLSCVGSIEQWGFSVNAK